WSGAGANANWSNGANWIGGVAPKGLASSLDDLVFPSGPSGAALSPVDDLTVSGGGNPTFNSITVNGSGYSITGNAITLGSTSVPSSGSIIAGASVANDNIGLNIKLNGATGNQQFVTVNLNGNL